MNKNLIKRPKFSILEYIKLKLGTLVESLTSIRDKTNFRAAKMGYNPRVNPAHHGFRPVGFEKIAFILCGSELNPAHVG